MSIDKFDGPMSKEELGCTIVVNSTMQSIKDGSVLAVYAYLITKPASWNINVLEIRKHFGYSKDKIYRIIDALIALFLLDRHEMREKGKFSKYHYILHLKPRTNTEESPCPDFRDTVLRDTVNKDTYKTKKLKNKDNNKTKENTAKAATPFLELLKTYKIRHPKKPNEKVIKFLNTAVTLLEEKETGLEQYLSYLVDRCSDWLYLPWGDRQRCNDEISIILKPAIINDALAGKYEDKKHVVRN